MTQRRRFLFWLAALGSLWALANLPYSGGSLKSWLRWAGCPWTFAFWGDGRLEWFDPAALVADILLGGAVIVTMAWLCARSRPELDSPR